MHALLEGTVVACNRAHTKTALCEMPGLRELCVHRLRVSATAWPSEEMKQAYLASEQYKPDVCTISGVSHYKGKRGGR